MTDLESFTRGALATLGSTTEEVAETLKHRGIRGNRRNGTHCPIAEYLRMTLKSAGEAEIAEYMWGVGVCSDSIGVGIGERVAYIDTPPFIGHFIEAFDRGGYPELDEEQAED